MTNPSKKYKDRPILSVEEIDDMIQKTHKLPTQYFQLRASCLIALVKKFGKRRIELARLKRVDFNVVKQDLEVTFSLAKKRKKGLFQYLKLLEKIDPAALSRPLPEIQAAWRLWQETEQGHRIKTDTSLQSISLDDKYARFILDYLRYMEEHYGKAKYLFPSGMIVFGQTYIIFPDEHLSGRQLLRIIKPLDSTAWLHLFRETKGAEIAREHGRTITSVYEVKDALDLENEETAYRYVRRYAAKKQTLET